ncbi:MAG: archaeosortase/exosortase family protein, partial [Pseudomonadota bacterium]
MARPLTFSLAGLTGLILLMLIAWHGGVLHMVSVWQNSPAYVHGFLVPLVSAGLIYDGWRKGEKFTTWPLALAGVAASAAFYGVATFADLQVGQHIAVVSGLISVLALVLGRSFAIRHRFALLFLYCAVPMGEEIVPLLQEITASA